MVRLRPTVGLNQPSWMPRKNWATKASTKTGSEMSTRLTQQRHVVEERRPCGGRR